MPPLYVRQRMKLSYQSFLLIALILTSCDSKERKVDGNDEEKSGTRNQKTEGETANVASHGSSVATAVEALPQNQEDGAKEEALTMEIANLDRRITRESEMVSYFESTLKLAREEVTQIIGWK